MVNFMTEYVGEKKAWSIVYGIFGVIAAILFFLCFAGCKERIHENEEEKTEKIRVIDGVKAVLKNKYWHMLMVICIKYGLYSSCNCNLFLCTSGCEEVWKRKDYDVWLDYYLCQLCDIVTIYRKYNGTDYYSCYEGNRILLLACSVFCDGK